MAHTKRIQPNSDWEQWYQAKRCPQKDRWTRGTRPKIDHTGLWIRFAAV